VTRAAALLAALALVAACSSSGDGADGEAAALPTPSTTTTTTTTPAAAPVTEPACAGRDADPGAEGSLTSGGHERTYLLDLPDGYDGTGPVPVIVNFHGYGSNAEQQAAYSGLGTAGAGRGYAVATPQALGDPPRWVFLPPVAGEVDDVAFSADLYDHLEATLCVDADREYAAGMSNGAAMSARLACALGDRLAAAAMVTANFYSPDCARTTPVAVISFHGTADPIVPYEGGPIAPVAAAAANGLPVPPEETTMQDWANHDGCDGGPAEDEPADGIRRLAWSGCEAGSDVVLYAVEGGGHTWPGAAAELAPLGETTREISATDLILDFFDAH
jgi:polyhydroxybutyrate depolymerase